MSLRSCWIGALLLVGMLGWTKAAQACGCVDWPPERRIAEADRIFLGRTPLHPNERALDVIQFAVVDMIKGAPASTVEIGRHPEDDCERSFQRGELALVFVVKGRLPVCAGNVDLDALMPTLGTYLGGDEHGKPDLDALKLALTGKLRGKKAAIYAPALAGKALQVGATAVRFIDKDADAVLTAGGVTHGPITYVALRTPDQIATYVLVGRDKGKLVVLHELRRDLKIK